MKRLIFIAAATVLAGCGKDNTKVPLPAEPVRMPEVVERAVKVPVYVDPELAADCYNEPAKSQTYDEAKRLALIRNKSIAECNKRLKLIRERHGGKP